MRRYRAHYVIVMCAWADDAKTSLTLAMVLSLLPRNIPDCGPDCGPEVLKSIPIVAYDITLIHEVIMNTKYSN